MSVPGEVTDRAQVRSILAESRTIAVLGASTDHARPGWYVPDYLHSQGYRILPVNPLHARHEAREWGEPYLHRLDELAGTAVDIVDVFRHPLALPQHLDDFLAMNPRPKVIWFQLGIRNDEVAAKLIAAGIEVVQNRCTLADHRAMGVGPVS